MGFKCTLVGLNYNKVVSSCDYCNQDIAKGKNSNKFFPLHGVLYTINANTTALGAVPKNAIATVKICG